MVSSNDDRKRVSLKNTPWGSSATIIPLGAHTQNDEPSTRVTVPPSGRSDGLSPAKVQASVIGGGYPASRDGHQPRIIPGSWPSERDPRPRRGVSPIPVVL